MTPAAPPVPSDTPLLEVENLRVSFGKITIVRDVSFSLRPGETLGIVGESGSGKSMTALALMRLLPPGGRIEADRLRLMGEDVLSAGEARLEALRGSAMGMIFQEPMTALNPVLTIGDQLSETVRRHTGIGAREARSRSIEALRRVGIPSPEQRIDDYPHRLSGGMRQRVMIAMALICRPKLLIADEPTTALDVTIQAQILDLMLGLQEEYRMGIILISHDLRVVSAFTDRVQIMYLGHVMEEGRAGDVFGAPRHPYTEALLSSIPPVDRDEERLKAIEGTVPMAYARPPGCPFEPRCGYARPECSSAIPPLVDLGAGHRAACIRNTGYAFAEAAR
ncbi:MAG: ABC transporter ATP-binding protein [Devosia sp.]|uniref:ABC transporter ATP-binding protein n=1 Tax=Devosia sp. 66-22 TaxID=1895753 RepID=UPI00092C9DCD|nr:ABC transporter ATP-binding protein [Devosia sp. 66-22]MBN9345366.1 ABC transporter ATP-binding protein [Devosia sp.]OJX50741.1 MAG: methionine ABC transporter ATP-binding protein [Devosia sp. 66-22]